MKSPAVEKLFGDVVQDWRDLAVILLDTRGIITHWNRGAEALFGYEPKEVIGQHLALLFLPDEQQRGIPDLELTNALTLGYAENVRWHLRKDGGRIFADGVTQALRAPDGKFLGFSKIARDLTERWRTEQKLASQLALTTLLADEQSWDVTARRLTVVIGADLGWDLGGLWIVDGERLTLCCLELCHSAGFSESQPRELGQVTELRKGVGLPGQVWNTGDPAWVVDLTEDPHGSGVGAVERLQIRSGFAFPLIDQGQVIGVMEFFSRSRREPDQSLLPLMALIGGQIGEYFVRRRTTEALRESEERYRVITETAQAAILTINQESTILFANSATERILGYALGELVGKKLDVIIPPRLRSRHHAGMARYLSTGQRNIPWGGYELPALHKDGREIPVLVSFGEWHHGEERIFTGFVYDISERKQMELEREQLLEQAQEANRSKDFFLAKVSHELRVPLTAILGWTEILRGQDYDRQSVPQAVEAIANSARLQSKLVSDLLEFSRILSGKLRLELRPVQLREIINAAVQSLGPELAAKRMELEVRTPVAVETQGDPQRLQQVVWNLLSNALKFSGEGQKIEVSLGRREGFAEIEVRDFGEGISAEHLPLLFQPFRQVVEGRHGGLGLGLAIVREIVERHGGTVEASSQGPGLGSAFTVRLPIRRTPK